jgi:hypothetical protein
MRRYAFPIGPTLVFVATFSTLVVAGALGMRHVAWLGFARREVPAIPATGPWFPVAVAGGGNLDHTILWNDIYSSIDDARRADVLFVGSSQIQFALPSHSVTAFERRTGLRAFSIAVPGGGYEFPIALIEKFDLRPRIVVAEIAIFRPPGDIPESRRVREASRWSGISSVLESRLGTATWSVGRRALPVFFAPHASQVLLRSSEDGTWWPIGWPHRDVPVADGGGPMRWSTPAARGFTSKLAARGARLVLTCIPGTVRGCSILAAEPLATALAVPALVPHVDGLSGMDMAHLCPLSGKRYGRVLLRELGRLDAVRAVARERRAMRLARRPSPVLREDTR